MSESKKSTYLGVTLGPIVRTLGQARKVRHLWGGSFLFSQLMRNIIEEISSAEASVFFERLLPRYDLHIDQLPQGVGLFPDRLYLRVKEGCESTATNKLNECLNKAVQKLGGGDNLNNYLQTYAVKVNITAGENYVEKLNQLLESVEQAPKSGGPVRFNLTDYLDNGALGRFYQSAFVSQRKQFETVAEIAAADLAAQIPKYDEFIEKYRKQIGKKHEDDFFKLLAEAEGWDVRQLKQHHKYVAIVHADGDSIGRVLRGIGADDKALEAFSKRLFDFATTATRRIDDWGGMPVYAGGDDLLFVAPVVMGGETIFKLLSDIEACFNEKVVEGANYATDASPTLSFGVNISYYKFPLAESLNQSRNRLYLKAKKHSGKNCTAFRVQKHSGSDFDAIVPHHTATTGEQWKTLLHRVPNEGEKKLFRSLIYTLETFEYLLTPLLETDTLERLPWFFQNHFNESIHRTAEAKAQIAAVQALLTELRSHHADAQSALKSAFGVLRFIQFTQADFNT